MLKKVAVIGVGYLGQHHARILSEFQDVELSGVVDTDIDRAKEVAALYRTRAFRDYRDLLGDIDAVSIVTPTVTHFEICREALIAGKDVFVEKPLTVTIDEAEELVRLSKERNRILQVGHLERYNPAYQRAKEFIKDPLFILAERLSPFSGRGTDVDITFDLMIHDIDIIVDTLRHKRLNFLEANGYSLVTDKVDFAEARLVFNSKSDSCEVQLIASRIAEEKKRTHTLYCKDYILVIDFMEQKLRRGVHENGKLIFEDIPVEKKEPLKEELRDFVDCINSRRCPLVPGEDVLYPLSIAIDMTKKLRRLN
ncbi:MAG: Gfo/Idh/MocA family oxidoreductase [Thermodesulfovibrionales bacterium]|nr:Gfo/Idh/MocA family oxidoreductase [Thermodesulfovibrionales bacterium]